MPKGLIRHVFVTNINPGSFKAGACAAPGLAPVQLSSSFALASQLVAADAGVSVRGQLAAADAGVSACAAPGLAPVQLRSPLPLLARAATLTCR